MEIKIGNNKFYIGESESNPIAVIEYYYQDQKVIVGYRTFVQKEYRGQGLAKQLLDTLVSFARANQLKIVPKCSYIKAVFDRDMRLQDIRY